MITDELKYKYQNNLKFYNLVNEIYYTIKYSKIKLDEFIDAISVVKLKLEEDYAKEKEDKTFH